MWRKLEKAVRDVHLSENYAQEYMARLSVTKLVDDLKMRNMINISIFGVKGFNNERE